jgi:MFS family permease
MSFAAASAGNVLVCANIGGAIGGAIFGFLTLRFDPKKLTVAVTALGALFIALFGFVPSMLDNVDVPLNSVPTLFGSSEVDHLYTYLGLFAFLCGITGNTAIVGMFALFAHAFPTHVRASGTGFAVGIGRGGAILSPIIVGFLFEWGFSLPVVTLLISIGGFAGAAVLLFLKINDTEKMT